LLLIYHEDSLGIELCVNEGCSSANLGAGLMVDVAQSLAES